MMTRWPGRIAILSSVIAGSSGGCIKPAVYTTKQMTIPVMIGPVKTLRAQQPANLGRATSEFRTEAENYFFVSSHREGNYNVTTTGWKRQGAGRFDRAFADALVTCPTCTATTNRVRVGSYYMYLLFSLLEKNWAAIDGSTHGW